MKKLEEIKISDLIASHFFKNEDLIKYETVYKNSIGIENWNDSGYHYIFEIKNTIHYKSISNNDFNLYNEYIKDGWNINREDLFRVILENDNDEKLFV